MIVAGGRVGQPLGDFEFSGAASLRCLQGCDAYDTENNLVSITDASAHSTFFAYDAFGRVTNMNFPSTLSETYAYDADNNSGFGSPVDSTESPDSGPRQQDGP
jgi:YD repeat-containing protein